MVEKCGICGKEFDSKKGLKIHKSRTHKNKDGGDKKGGTKKDEKWQMLVLSGIIVIIVLIIISIFLINMREESFEYGGFSFEYKELFKQPFGIEKNINFDELGFVVYQFERIGQNIGERKPFLILSTEEEEKRQKKGKIKFYVTNFTSERFNSDVQYFFRNDPRELEDIKIKDEIELGNPMYIVDGGMNCSEKILAATSLDVNFLNRLGIKTEIATFDKNKSEEKNMTHIECEEDHKSIVFREGNKSSIEKEGSCYYLNVNNCEVMEVSEKFVLGWYEDFDK